MDAKQIHVQSEQFATQHLVECAQEILEWSKTGILCDGRVRELARMWDEVETHNALRIAQSFTERAAYKAIVASSQL